MNSRSRLPPPGPLPDSNALRARALAASWRRDRTVHRRRLAWRWVQWAFVRYGVPALVGATAVVLLVSLVLQWVGSPAPASAPTAAPSAAAPPPGIAAPPATGPSPSEAAAPPLAGPAEPDLMPPLRLDTLFGQPARTAMPPSQAPFTPPDPDIHLQPDDYLHSKEP